MLLQKLVTKLSEEVSAGHSLAGVAQVATALRALTQQRSIRAVSWALGAALVRTGGSSCPFGSPWPPTCVWLRQLAGPVLPWCCWGSLGLVLPFQHIQHPCPAPSRTAAPGSALHAWGGSCSASSSCSKPGWAPALVPLVSAGAAAFDTGRWGAGVAAPRAGHPGTPPQLCPLFWGLVTVVPRTSGPRIKRLWGWEGGGRGLRRVGEGCKWVFQPGVLHLINHRDTRIRGAVLWLWLLPPGSGRTVTVV